MTDKKRSQKLTMSTLCSYELNMLLSDYFNCYQQIPQFLQVLSRTLDESIYAPWFYEPPMCYRGVRKLTEER
ncbi:hypothetical protein DPMN_122267 [Dreissena polymorpha]|uniref:Uncharacterized protein n=1 Tax=Dreissena polymorpha TaxID=45954 RepID=A0A9D4GPC1_DREPO|nr:hypothetical protein DPMN_122267 [Dreissena polymorpha]